MKKLILTLCLLCSYATNSYAIDDLYIGVDFGPTFIMVNDDEEHSMHLNAALVTGVRPFPKDTLLHLLRVDLNLGVTGSGEDSGDPWKWEYSNLNFMVNAYIDIPINDIGFYLMGGVGMVRHTLTYNTPRWEDSQTTVASQIGIGVLLGGYDNDWTIDFSVRHFNAGEPEYSTGYIQDINGWQIEAGYKLHFL
ncbi:MAG: porin family protein [Deferribacteraceae bacterium]|nr:porin family protein [Deferribacteraceae bacterium]